MLKREIFLIEDNPDDVLLAVRALEKNNIENPLIIARDGEEALDFLLQGKNGIFSDHLPALVLLDLKLPKISGTEVLKALRENPGTRRLPVIVLSTSGEEKDIINCYNLGANSYIKKPVDFQQFIRIMKTVGTYWLEINETPPELDGVQNGL